MKNYRSSIPKAADERLIADHESTPHLKKFEYWLDGELVGVRWISLDGSSGSERPIKDGVTHGTMYYFNLDPDGSRKPTFAEPYRSGLAHGTAKQWSDYDGRPIGTYAMKSGTGVDLWRYETYFGASVYLHEARYIKDGNWHGFEWWLNEDQNSVHQEAHFWENLQHGIRREWNSEGRLKRGFPQYWVNNERVPKRKYLSACAKDPNLPPYRKADDLPQRTFPPTVQAAIEETRQLNVGQ